MSKKKKKKTPPKISSMEDIQYLVSIGFNNWKRFGEVSVKEHDDLLIFNYTPLAVYAARWNFFETVSRGLIINKKTCEVVARPFDKFFNWFEGGRKAGGHITNIMEKMDGSLGILYRHNGKYNIATRGSFNSDQAIWATQRLRDQHDLSGLDESLTLLFEIIYPENRVVVDYEGKESLVLLAARNRFDGSYLSFFPDVYTIGHKYGFDLPKTYNFANPTEILEKAAGLSENEEGYIATFSDGTIWKFKSYRYLELHAKLQKISFKSTLEAVSNGSLDQLYEGIPDEFLDEVKKWVVEINETVEAIKGHVNDAMKSAPTGPRKAFAKWVYDNHRHIAPYLFAYKDGKDITNIIYKKHGWDERHPPISGDK